MFQRLCRHQSAACCTEEVLARVIVELCLIDILTSIALPLQPPVSGYGIPAQGSIAPVHIVSCDFSAQVLFCLRTWEAPVWYRATMKRSVVVFSACRPPFASRRDVSYCGATFVPEQLPSSVGVAMPAQRWRRPHARSHTDCGVAKGMV